MTIEQQLPYILILFLILSIGFFFFLVWLGYKVTDSTLKRTYSEILHNNSELQALLNQDYNL
jgi:TRAP-type C4-dicarboxylate transport system permease small subunit